MIDAHLMFPILFVIALVFWASLAIIVDKLIDLIERKRKN